MNTDLAVAITLQKLKEGTAGRYGFDCHPVSIAIDLAWSEGGGTDSALHERTTAKYHPYFEDAAWLLSLRGILRRGVTKVHGQDVDGGGYSLTMTGRELINNFDDGIVILYQSSSLVSTFEGFQSRFGDGYVQRAVEAVRCRDASVWLSTCVMCGAAAESILLALAIGKTWNDALVLKTYRGTSGRRNLVRMISGTWPEHKRSTFESFTGLIATWRDEAGHGLPSTIGPAIADEALRQLLHMSRWVDTEWPTLTSGGIS